MAAFQINVTPPLRKVTRREKSVEIVTPKVILAPFNPTPEIGFGSVTVNTKVTKPLIIFNSNSQSVNVQLKNIDPEDRISVSDYSIQLNGGEEREIYVSWSPLRSGYLRKIIRVQDVCRKARSFDVILTGTCVSNKTCDKMKRLKNEHKLKTNISNPKRCGNNTQPYQCIDSDIRRQTYLIEEKENCVPIEMRSDFCTSSPKHQNSNSISYFNDDLRLFDRTDTYTKYSNFESELKCNADVSSLHSSIEMNSCRRGTYTLNSEEIVRNPFSLSSVDELDGSLCAALNVDDGLRKENIRTPNGKNVTFDAKVTPENVRLTPIKSLSSLLTPGAEFPELFEMSRTSIDCDITCDLSKDSLSFSSKKKDLIFISPPIKTKSSKRSPDCAVVRRHVSSAISDRKKHLKTNILPRRKTPPSAMKINKVIPSIEKMKTQDPTSLKQVLRSHIDDPFLKQSLYCDENWIGRQEKDIIKWMNSLLTPPVELHEETDWTVDAAAVWLQSCRDGDLRSVPSVDNIAAAIYYHSPQRLDTLRKVASSLLGSEPICSVFEKIAVIIQKKIISIREDRDLHLDQGLKNKLLQLLSCYNPLWLQIALEAIYDQKITRQAKSDVGGMGWFIRKHVLTGSISNKKHAHPAVLQITKPNFKDQVKKHILQKFLCLIYFLDQAKTRKLIRHNPCLFVISSEYKSSQDLLLAFCSDLVVGRGDITKHLKAINYVLQYKQTCIDEYDYSITSLHDLKDGVRLTRLFEILFNEPDLCSKLRVPAISILQKIYNVSVAMKVAESKCSIEGDITAKEIVSGHREKILSFLWQIINNYITPLYEKSAILIQRWWRERILPMLQLKKQQEHKLQISATIIQSAWRGYVHRKKFAIVSAEIKENRVKLQRAAVVLQRRFRANRELRKQDEAYKMINFASIKLQAWWRCKLQRKKFLSSKSKIIWIQRRFRAKLKMKRDRENFLRVKLFTVVVQRLFRANRMMCICRQNFINLKKSAVLIQTRFRAKLKSRIEFQRYCALKRATIYIQTRFRSFCQMKHDRESYLKLRTSTVYLQQKYLALRAMKQQYSRYHQLKTATICIQRRFRANQAMKQEYQKYIELKSSAILLQRKFRAAKIMKQQRSKYLKLKHATVTIQRKFRETQSMKHDYLEYQKLKSCCILIQSKFRSRLIMKSDRYRFLKLKTAALSIQRLFRMKRKMMMDRNNFIKIKRSVILIQRKFRANKLVKRERESFLKLKQIVILIQRRFRSYQLMKREQNEYFQIRSHVILVQSLFRANRAMKMERKRYSELKKAVVAIQKRFRSICLMKEERARYNKIKSAVILVQRKFKATLLMKKYRQQYLKLRNTCNFVQQKFKANLTMKMQRNAYLKLRNIVIFVQRTFNANRIMRLERTKFQDLKKAAIIVQRKYRAISLMRCERDYFIRLKSMTVFIQRLYRAKVLARKYREEYTALKSVAITVQKVFRTNRLARIQHRKFINIKKATVLVQRKYRALKMMQRVKNKFLRFKNAAIVIQNWFRTRIARRIFLIQREAAITIQRKYRNSKEMRTCRINFLKMKYIACIIQNRYRIMKQTNKLLEKFMENSSLKFNYIALETTTISSSHLALNKIDSIAIAVLNRMKFITLKISTIFIQRRFKKKLQVGALRKRLRIQVSEVLAAKTHAAIKIQAYWRGYQVRKKIQIQNPNTIIKKPHSSLDARVTLEKRCEKAILQLKTSDMYDVITHALWNLESVTMLSAKLCEGVAAEHIIPIIFNLMARGNRSEPSLEIYRAGCSILINLARHKPTKIVLWKTINKVDDIFLILHIMKITHDKAQIPVFRYAATLLWLLCQDNTAAQIIRNLYSFQQQIEKMLEKLKRLNLKNAQLKKSPKTLPKTEADWFSEPQRRIFENNFVAIVNIHSCLYGNR